MTKLIPPDPDDIIVPASVLEQDFSLTNKAIRRLAIDEHIVKAPGQNKYYFHASVQKYIQHLTANAADTTPGLVEEKLLLLHEQKLFWEVRNKKINDELIPREQIRPSWMRTAVAFRQAMLAIPSKARLRISKLTAKDLKLLEGLIRDGLTSAGVVPESPPEILGLKGEI
jgi:phage terminase Nu1 subunit (DNA packaging protein)